MLFSAGMGIGLVFWGAAEPLSHYAVSAPQGQVATQEALEDAFKYTFFHWGIHAWAVYAVVALALAYFKFRKKEKSLISVTLKPILGQNTDGFLGKIIDSITVFATVIGVATTLGFGAVQINGGLRYLFGVPKNIYVQIIIITVTTILFIMSALSGIGKGVKILSNINAILAIGLLSIAIIVGPTISIMNTFVDTLGGYLQDFLG
jgi:glycine betaine transporter